MSGVDSKQSAWPEPTDWVNRLYQEMAERWTVYDAERDPLLKRNKAGGMLGLVISSLRELPAFKNDSVDLPLKDLMIFLSDLDRGRDHPWSAPFNFGGTNITTTAKGELKIWVRAAFGLLEKNGFKRVAAYRRIASGLTDSGRSGRNGKPVRWQRIQAWCSEAEGPSDHRVKERVERWWADFRAAAPVAGQDLAGSFADRLWSLPHFRDCSVSPPA